MTDFKAIDFFRDDDLIVDPYPYFEAIAAEGPVRPEPHHGVVMVTGYDEAMAIYSDTDTFSSCNCGHRAVPRVPRAARGRRRQRPHRASTATSCR